MLVSQMVWRHGKVDVVVEMLKVWEVRENVVDGIFDAKPKIPSQLYRPNLLSKLRPQALQYPRMADNSIEDKVSESG